MTLSTACDILRKHPVIKCVYRVSQDVETPIYLVGGAVRDVLMGIAPEKDFDFVMHDNLVKSARLFSRIFEGAFFPLSADPPNYRVVLARHDHRIEVDFSGFRGDDLYHDLINRDFTVNAIALEVGDLYREGEIKFHDPLGGGKDIQTKVLRLASPNAFDQDPLRLLRAVRIARERDLQIDIKTKEAIYRQRKGLQLVSAERIRSEFFKIVNFPGALDSLKFLDDLGLLSILFPDIESFKGEDRESSRRHPALNIVYWCEWSLSNLGKIFFVFPEAVKSLLEEKLEEDIDRRSLLKLAGFFIEVEKKFPMVKALALADIFATRLKLGKRTGRALWKIVKFYNQVLSLQQMKKSLPRVYFQFLQKVNQEAVAVLLLAWADFIARAPEKFTRSEDMTMRNFSGDLLKFYVKEYPFMKPLLSGQDIIEKFGLQEGKTVGELLNRVAQTEAEGLLSSPQDAAFFVEDLLRNKNKTA